MKLTGFLVVMALLLCKSAQPEEVSWIRKSADMQINVTCHTGKLTLPGLPFLCRLHSRRRVKGDKLQALTGVLDSVLQLHAG